MNDTSPTRNPPELPNTPRVASSSRTWSRSMPSTVVPAAVLLILAFLAAWHWYGSVGALRVAAAGRHLYLPLTEIDLGTMSAGETKTVEVAVENVIEQLGRIGLVDIVRRGHLGCFRDTIHHSC